MTPEHLSHPSDEETRSSVEALPASLETGPASLDVALEKLNHDAAQNELSVVAGALKAREGGTPAHAEARAGAAAKALDGLRRARIAAAVAFALTLGGAPETAQGGEHTQGALTAEELQKNPARTEELLEGVRIIVEHLEAQSAEVLPEVEALGVQTNEVLERLQGDVSGEGGRSGALALTVAEHAARALASAAGLGLAVSAYDMLKAVVKESTTPRR